MRLDYTILCIDDNIGSLRSTKSDLARHNNSVGIETKFIDISVVQVGRSEVDLSLFRDRIFSDIAKKFDDHQIDLVIVDLHLGEIKGHEIIEHIRSDQTMYRPIVFYSGGEGSQVGTLEEHATKQLQDGLQQHNLIGKSVFLSVRGENLIRDLRGICGEMHEEEHKLNASRGLLMDRTSEIDAMTLEYLKSQQSWKGLTDEQNEKLLKELKSELKRQAQRAKNKSETLASLEEKTLDDIVDWAGGANPTDLDAMGWNKFLRALLKTRSENSELADSHKGYFNDADGKPSISNLRNQYAHQTAEQIGNAHDLDRCKFIRDQLRVHLKNINLISKVTE